MNGFRNKMAEFMQGRYGADETFYILTGIYLVLVFANIFVHSWTLHILSLLVFAYTMYRSLSRNIPKRSRENAWVLSRTAGLRKSLQKAKTRYEQNEDYCFKKCPNCKRTLRLPRVKGRHNTKCPACGTKFSVKISWGRPQD